MRDPGLKSNRAFYRRLGKNSVVIAHDTPGKRAEYEDYLVRTFFVRSGDAQTIADALTLTLGLQTVSVDIEENAITVRDTPDRLLLADQLINVKDRRPAEVVIEVEVLQVNRTKSEHLGLDFGDYKEGLTVQPPSGRRGGWIGRRFAAWGNRWRGWPLLVGRFGPSYLGAGAGA